MPAETREIQPPSDLPIEPIADVVILPRHEVDGRGEYERAALTLGKELRASGVSAEYLHSPDRRDWIGERAAELVIALTIGLASNAGWSAIQHWILQRHSNDHLHLKLVRISGDEGGNAREWLEIEGHGADVIEALETLKDNRDREEET